MRGARQSGLANLDLDLPREALVVVTGLSGSGKSSLVFDTIAAEGRRRYLEAAAVDRRAGESLGRRPAVDRLEGLPPTLALDQRPRGAGQTLLAEALDLADLLRRSFLAEGTLNCPRGHGPVRAYTLDEAVAVLLKSGEDRVTLEAPLEGSGESVREEILRAGFSRVRLGDQVARLEELPPGTNLRGARVVVDRLRLDAERQSRLAESIRMTWQAGRQRAVAVFGASERVLDNLPRCSVCALQLPALDLGLLEHFGRSCASCGGSDPFCAACRGLPAIAADVTWAGASLGALGSSPLATWAERLPVLPAGAVASVAREELLRRLVHALDLGLGSLPGTQPLASLSGSEAQRVRVLRLLSAPLSGVLYALDEPTAGLPAEVVPAMIRLFRQRVKEGNSLLVVEHRAEVIEAADWVVELGPGAGPQGGRLQFVGPPAGLRQADTWTGRLLRGELQPAARPARRGRGALNLGPLGAGPLAGYQVQLPLEVFGVLSGPAGSGKSTLLRALSRTDALRPLWVDDAPARTRRGLLASWMGLWTPLRELLAAVPESKVRGFGPGMFSLSTSGGRCEVCQGAGQQEIELGALPPVLVPCMVCDGRRFERAILEIHYRGLNADEWLRLTVGEARSRLQAVPKLEALLRALTEVGLSYLELGRSLDALSGGEAQRLALARELARARGGAPALYLVDTPEAGLHRQDLLAVTDLFQSLVDAGSTVYVASSDPALMAIADHVHCLPTLRTSCG